MSTVVVLVYHTLPSGVTLLPAVYYLSTKKSQKRWKILENQFEKENLDCRMKKHQKNRNMNNSSKQIEKLMIFRNVWKKISLINKFKKWLIYRNKLNIFFS